MALVSWLGCPGKEIHDQQGKLLLPGERKNLMKANEGTCRWLIGTYWISTEVSLLTELPNYFPDVACQL